MPAAKRKPAMPTAPGVIQPGSLYTAEEARRRLRLGDWAWRQMRRDGLAVLRVSGRSYVLGSALITYLAQRGGERPTDSLSNGIADR